MPEELDDGLKKLYREAAQLMGDAIDTMAESEEFQKKMAAINQKMIEQYGKTISGIINDINIVVVPFAGKSLTGRDNKKISLKPNPKLRQR